MSTLSGFSEKERDYHRYQSRQEALRQQRAIQRQQLALQREQLALQREQLALQRSLEEARAIAQTERQAKEDAILAQEAERQAKEDALAEIARLKALLQQQRPS